MTDYFVACRVNELKQPHVPSVKRICQKCRKEVWVDVNLQTLCDRNTLLCVPCAAITSRPNGSQGA